jgi:hypothetical protein
MSGDVVFIHMVFFPLLKWIECCCDRFLRGEKQKPQVGAAKSGSVLAVTARVLGFVRRSMCQKPSLRGVAFRLVATIPSGNTEKLPVNAYWTPPLNAISPTATPPAEIIKLLIVGARRRIVVSPNATKLTWDNFYRQVGKPETAGLVVSMRTSRLSYPHRRWNQWPLVCKITLPSLISPSVTPY